MNCKIFVILTLALVSVHGLSLDPCANKKIDGRLDSLMCIVYRLCKTNSQDPAIAENFFDCYAGRKGEDQFLGCMEKNFDGKLLNSQENVEWACKRWNLWRLVPYGACLGPAMKEGGVNQTEAVTVVNQCQGTALGF